jgi:acetyl-CoA carboxylase carboxyl transferase subunit alpha
VKADRAAAALKLDAISLDKFGIVDEVIAEPFGGAHHDPAKAANALGYALRKHLNDLKGLSPEKIVETRYERFRHLGVYEEAGAIKS